MLCNQRALRVCSSTQWFPRNPATPCLLSCVTVFSQLSIQGSHGQGVQEGHSILLSCSIHRRETEGFPGPVPVCIPPSWIEPDPPGQTQSQWESWVFLSGKILGLQVCTIPTALLSSQLCWACTRVPTGSTSLPLGWLPLPTHCRVGAAGEVETILASCS